MNINNNKSVMLSHSKPCLSCGSSDALATYRNYPDDEEGFYDTWHCFSCNETGRLENNDTAIKSSKINSEEFTFINDYPIRELKDRGISEKTAKKFGVRVKYDESTGVESVYYYPFFKDNELVSYKERHLPKTFKWTNKTGTVDLFGQHLARNNGKFIIVTEGLDDCMAGYQMLKKKNKNYSIVGLPDGVNCLKKHIEYLNGFDKIVLCFDSDDVGVKAARKGVELFKPSKASVTCLPTGIKDVNQLLLEGGDEAPDVFLNAIYNAKTITPVGIVNLNSVWGELFKDDNISSVPYPWDGLNKKLYGLRPRELITITAGSGLGKSAITRELEYYLLKNTEDNIGILALEEDVARTGWGIMSIEANKPLHIREEREDVSKKDLKIYFNNTLNTGRLFTLDHFGSTQSEVLMNKIRYLVNGLDCKWIFLDHLSIVVSGMEDAGNNERIVIDKLMTDLRSLVQETGCGMILVSHLRRTGGDKGHEKGEEVSLSHLRGSQSIAQLSDAVIALERNQQAQQEKDANRTVVRVLKNRYAGLTGIACSLDYNKDTGRLSEGELTEEMDI